MRGVTIELSGEAKALLARLPDVPAKAAQSLAQELDHQNELTIGYAQRTKLSASSATTLGVRTGRLRRSLSRSQATISGSTITASIGSNVVYAAIHEFGLDGPEQVGAFTRRNPARDLVAGKKRRLVASGVSYVKAFTRHMKMPARSFIRSSLEERAPQIGQGLSAAVMRALEGGA